MREIGFNLSCICKTGGSNAENAVATALTVKKISNKNFPFFKRIRDNRVIQKTISSQALERKEVFIKKTKEKIIRAETRKHLIQFHLSCELLKVIQRFFLRLVVLAETNPGFTESEVHHLPEPDSVADEDSFFYILHQSMRKTSEEFNCEAMIENIDLLAGQELEEVPYWETINNYLNGVRPEEL